MINEKQRLVAEELERNILLLASAGTGKTSTLAERIKNILQQGKARAEEILCITFTNRACRELERKIAGRQLDMGAGPVIRTVHGFCYDIIRSEAQRSGGDREYTIFDEDDCRELIRELTNRKPAAVLQNFINLVKHSRSRYGIDSEDPEADYQATVAELFENEPDKIQRLGGPLAAGRNEWQHFLRREGATLTARYDGELRRLQGLDFNDLILQVFELFKEVEVRERWRQKYKYVMIDEMQDTSRFEYDILSALFAGNNIMLCGDYFQTIYEWRGSEPFAILHSFREQWDPLKISFGENYRATKTLLAASFACLQAMFGKMVNEIYEEPFCAAKEETGTKIALKQAGQMEEEARWIFEEIRKLGPAGGDLAKIAILTRNNGYNQDLSEAFVRFNAELPTEERIGFLMVDAFRFFRRQEIKDVLAGLRYLRNPKDAGSLKRLLLRFAPGLGERTLAVVDGTECRAAGIGLPDFVASYPAAAADPFAPLLAAIEKGTVVVFDVESTGLDTDSDDIIQIAAVRLGREGECAVFERFLRPGRPVGASFAVHGFSDDFLAAQGQEPGACLQAFAGFAAGSVIVGHNVAYDMKIFCSQAGRLGVRTEGFGATVFDTLDLYRRFYPGRSTYKLEALSREFAAAERPAHNALEDVRTTAELLLRLVERRLEPTAGVRRAYMEKYGPVFAPSARLLSGLRLDAQTMRPSELIAALVDKLQIKDFYRRCHQEDRVGRLRELYLVAREMEAAKEKPPADAQREFLRFTALSSSALDHLLDKRPRIPILTVHQAKGSEFDYVFLAGLQEGIFPSFQSLAAERIEEEKRLFYVALTRAQSRLYLSWSRRYRGKVCQRSRFLDSLPAEYVETAAEETSLFLPADEEGRF